MQRDTSGVQTRLDGSGQAAGMADLQARLDDLADADLLALRLSAQVLGHKAALVGRRPVERWFADLAQQVSFALARRGVGLVLGSSSELRLSATANADDRRLLADHLGLLAANDGLSASVRRLSADLRSSLPTPT